MSYHRHTDRHCTNMRDLKRTRRKPTWLSASALVLGSLVLGEYAQLFVPTKKNTAGMIGLVSANAEGKIANLECQAIACERAFQMKASENYLEAAVVIETYLRGRPPTFEAAVWSEKSVGASIKDTIGASRLLADLYRKMRMPRAAAVLSRQATVWSSLMWDWNMRVSLEFDRLRRDLIASGETNAALRVAQERQKKHMEKQSSDGSNLIINIAEVMFLDFLTMENESSYRKQTRCMQRWKTLLDNDPYFKPFTHITNPFTRIANSLHKARDKQRARHLIDSKMYLYEGQQKEALRDPSQVPTTSPEIYRLLKVLKGIESKFEPKKVKVHFTGCKKAPGCFPELQYSLVNHRQIDSHQSTEEPSPKTLSRLNFLNKIGHSRASQKDTAEVRSTINGEKLEGIYRKATTDSRYFSFAQPQKGEVRNGAIGAIISENKLVLDTGKQKPLHQRLIETIKTTPFIPDWILVPSLGQFELIASSILGGGFIFITVYAGTFLILLKIRIRKVLKLAKNSTNDANKGSSLEETNESLKVREMAQSQIGQTSMESNVRYESNSNGNNKNSCSSRNEDRQLHSERLTSSSRPEDKGKASLEPVNFQEQIQQNESEKLQEDSDLWEMTSRRECLKARDNKELEVKTGRNVDSQSVYTDEINGNSDGAQRGSDSIPVSSKSRQEEMIARSDKNTKQTLTSPLQEGTRDLHVDNTEYSLGKTQNKSAHKNSTNGSVVEEDCNHSIELSHEEEKVTGSKGENKTAEELREERIQAALRNMRYKAPQEIYKMPSTEELELQSVREKPFDRTPLYLTMPETHLSTIIRGQRFIMTNGPYGYGLYAVEPTVTPKT